MVIGITQSCRGKKDQFILTRRLSGKLVIVQKEGFEAMADKNTRDGFIEALKRRGWQIEPIEMSAETDLARLIDDLR